VSEPFIVDAHAHIGLPGVFFAPESSPNHLLAIMDLVSIRFAVLACDHVTLHEGAQAGLPLLRQVYEQSEGRLPFLGVFDPRDADASLAALERASDWPGFAGLKLHPSFHRVWAEDPIYEQAWRFAADHELAILTHSWSISDYNPAQRYSTPERFEGYVRRFPQVRLVLGHAGGRGSGRREAVRMTNEYPNVYLDFAGDIFCDRLMETLVKSVPPDRILFGSDFPWIDPRANLSRVLLADIDDQFKRKILSDNAHAVYKIRVE
jgi:predicted TIM-barrel fold metal-dependent hydrolase